MSADTSQSISTGNTSTLVQQLTALPQSEQQQEQNVNSEIISTVHIMPQSEISLKNDPNNEGVNDPPPALVSANAVLASLGPSLMSLQPNLASSLVSLGSTLSPSLASSLVSLGNALNPSLANSLVSYGAALTSTPASAPVTTPSDISADQAPMLVTVSSVSSSIPTLTAVPVPQATVYTSTNLSTTTTTSSPSTQTQLVDNIKEESSMPPSLVASPLSSVQVTAIPNQASSPTGQIAINPSQLQLQNLQAPGSPNGSVALVNQLMYSTTQAQVTSPPNSSSKVGKGKSIIHYLGYGNLTIVT